MELKYDHILESKQKLFDDSKLFLKNKHPYGVKAMNKEQGLAPETLLGFAQTHKGLLPSLDPVALKYFFAATLARKKHLIALIFQYFCFSL